MNHNEEAIGNMYKSLGYDLIHTGIPDLICLKGGKILFIEIKNKGDYLSKNQARAIRLLEKHKFDVKIEGEGSERAEKRYSHKSKTVLKFKCLTGREEQVLETLLKRGNVRFLVAEDLGITEHAVESCISRIRQKLEDAPKVRRRYKDILVRQR